MTEDVLIRKQDVIKLYHKYAKWLPMDIRQKYWIDIQWLPTMDLKQTGRWIDDCSCSICHWTHEDNKGFALLTNYNFCPNCGSKMEVK